MTRHSATSRGWLKAPRWKACLGGPEWTASAVCSCPQKPAAGTRPGGLPASDTRVLQTFVFRKTSGIRLETSTLHRRQKQNPRSYSQLTELFRRNYYSCSPIKNPNPLYYTETDNSGRSRADAGSISVPGRTATGHHTGTVPDLGSGLTQPANIFCLSFALWCESEDTAENAGLRNVTATNMSLITSSQNTRVSAWLKMRLHYFVFLLYPESNLTTAANLIFHLE